MKILPLKPHTPPLLMLATGTLAFIAISADILYHGQLWQIDRAIAPYLHDHNNETLKWIAAAISGLGDLTVLLPFAVFIATALTWKKQWRCLLTWALGLLLSGPINGLLKNAFAIPRPIATSQFPLDNTTYTYPSGHAMAVTVTAGLLALIYMRLKPRPKSHRRRAALLAASLGTLEAAALLYIGVHYLSDVLAALAISLVWLAILRTILPPASPQIPSQSPKSPDLPPPSPSTL